RTCSGLSRAKTEGKSNPERFNKCCSHRPVAGSARRSPLHQGKRPTGPWLQRLPSHLNTLETASDGANRVHNPAVNQRSFSALGLFAKKLCRWDIGETPRIGCNPACEHNTAGGRARRASDSTLPNARAAPASSNRARSFPDLFVSSGQASATT